MTNRQRAALVRPSIEGFRELAFGKTFEEEETVIGDFLCDLMHYIELETGTTWTAVLDHAERHFAHESQFAPDEEAD